MKFDETVREMVDDFQYLEAWVNDTVNNFKHQRAKTWAAFWKFKKIWNSNADIKLKIKFFNVSILNVLLYATETYVIDAALQNKIKAFQKQCLRILLNVSRDNHVRNEYIYKPTNTKPLMQRITKTQLPFLDTPSGETKTESDDWSDDAVLSFMYQHMDDIVEDERRQPASSTFPRQSMTVQWLKRK